MTTINDYLVYGETALAAYSANLLSGAVGINVDSLRFAGMPTAEATRFDVTWSVIEQSADLSNGFSAVLLQNRTTEEKVLAIRGTEGSIADFLTDLVNIVVLGSVSGMPQYSALETFYGSLVANGKLGASEAFTVTGHSLGGFLAQAFTAHHSNVVSAAYTYNAPGFGGLAGGPISALWAFLGVSVDPAISAKILNIRATDGISPTAGLGQVIGAVQELRIEAGTANPIYYHSIETLTDTLSVYKAYADLQPTLLVQDAANLFFSSGLGGRKLEGALDALRSVFMGTGSTTPTGDREAFFTNLTARQNSDAYKKTLAGHANISLATSSLPTTAKTDFAAFLSLNALSQVVISTTDAAAIAALKAANPELASDWTADKNARLFGDTARDHDFSDNWYADRAAMLATVINRNQTDQSNTLTPNAALGLLAGHCNDVTSNTDISVGTATTTARQYLFGHKEQAETTKSIAACAYQTRARGRVGFKTATNDSFKQAAA